MNTLNCISKFQYLKTIEYAIKNGKYSLSIRSKSTTSPKEPESTPSSQQDVDEIDPKSYYYPNTSVGIKERTVKSDGKQVNPLQTPYPPFPDGKNPKTGESAGPTGPEPTRYGDWERKGRVTDF